MRHSSTAIILSLVVLACGAFGWLAYESSKQSQRHSSSPSEDVVSLGADITASPKETLTLEERTGILFMREEEKLARDVYRTLYEQWDIRLFEPISYSEESHMNAVGALITKYNLTDPVVHDAVGVFSDDTLQRLYDELVERGMQSEIAALEVGAYIEELSLVDLERFSKATDNDDVRFVYAQLARGSRNHLRSFTAQLSARDVTYAPRFMDEASYNAVISTPRETGRGEQR